MYTQSKILSESPISISNVAEKFVEDNNGFEGNDKIPLVRSTILGSVLIWALLVFVGFGFFGISVI